MKQVRLLCKKPIPSGQEFLITSGQATIGKDTSNTISLPYKAISRRHATIIYDESEECYFLEDLKSHNGTLLDGERVRRKERLDSIHVITISNKFDIFFQLLGEKHHQEELADTEEMADDEKITVVKVAREKTKSSRNGEGISMVLDSSNREKFTSEKMKVSKEKRIRPRGRAIDEVIAYPAEPTVTIEKTRINIETPAGAEFVFQIDGSNVKYVLHAGENIIGRSKECTISLPDKTVSNRHACLVVDNGEIRLRDLESKNHTYVGDSLVKCWTRVKPNSRIRFGKVVGSLRVQKTAVPVGD
jgi:pSer/pThr/pTyr-binding forkhead associated (FHA) protein